MADSITEKRLNLVCIDASEHSRRAVEWYLSTLHREGDSVGLVHIHVLPELPSFGLYAGGLVATDLYQEQIRESIQASKKVVEKYKTMMEEKGIKPEIFCETMVDSIGHSVCEISKKNSAGSIVMGQRGLGAIRRTFLGSNSDYVLHHSNVPVAIIPPPQ